MSTTQLSLYNNALLALGERKLASLSENREPRRNLDDVYTGALKSCLEEADWKFAQRTSKLIYDPAFTASFGFTYRFDRPTDCVRWSKICTDERYNTPLLSYSEEGGLLYADLDEIYVSYVSNDASYGLDMSLWPESFTNFVELDLASRIVRRLEQSSTTEADIKKARKEALTNAKSKDALRGPTQFMPQGSWVSSRGSHIGGWQDRGGRGQLIG